MNIVKLSPVLCDIYGAMRGEVRPTLGYLILSHAGNSASRPFLALRTLQAACRVRVSRTVALFLYGRTSRVHSLLSVFWLSTSHPDLFRLTIVTSSGDHSFSTIYRIAVTFSSALISCRSLSETSSAAARASYDCSLSQEREPPDTHYRTQR